MPDVTDNFKNILKASGNSVTTARLTVFKALIGQEPLNMHQLTAACAPVDRASVYRAIELFEREGIVQRINTGWKYKLELTDKFAAHHHHLTCTNCGRTIAMNESELEAILEKLVREHQFLPSAHQIEIQGTCADCQASRVVNR